MKKNNLNNQLFQKRLNIFFASLFFIILAIFFYFKIVPSGHAHYQITWPSSFLSVRSNFSDFRPGLRIDNDESDFLKVISDPVYFSLFSPRNFDKAKVEITYSDKLGDETPIVELGLLKGGVNGSYELKAMQNNIIESLKSSWHTVSDEEGLLILEKSSNYRNQEEFFLDFNEGKLKDCDDVFTCATFYNYQLNLDYKLSPEINTSPIVINQALRGEHRFLVYFAKGEWNLKLNFRDLFLSDKSQDLKVEIYAQNELLESKTLKYNRAEVESLAFDNNKRQGQKVGSLSFSGIEEDGNLYKVVVKADNDVVIEGIESSSGHIVFLNKIWPVYNSENNKLYTDTPSLSIKTFETESLGSVYFDEKRFDLSKTYSNLELQGERSKKIKELELEKTGILIELNGVISLSRDNYFNPLPSKLDRFFSEKLKNTYLLANYKSPREKNDLKVVNLSFDLSGAIRDEGRYDFVVSIPGLVNNTGYSEEKSSENYLAIKEIKVELLGKSLWKKIKEKF